MTQVSDWVVLVVDDVMDYLEVTKITLGLQDAEVHTAQSITQAWQILQDIAPDVILLDMKMPGGDGSELLARLRSDARFAHIPVIAATAYAAVQREKREIMALGFDSYIAKPFSTNELMNTSHSVVNPGLVVA